MPQTYTVKLSDGRTFDVTTDGGAPSEASILASLKEPDFKTSNVPVSAADMVSGKVGRDTGAPEGTAEPDWKSKLADALEPLAHPRDPNDFLNLMLQTNAGTAIGEHILKPVAEAVAHYGGAAVDAASALLPTKAKAALSILKNLSPSEWNNPLTVAGREGRTTAATKAFNDLPLAQQQQQLPATPAPELAAPAPPSLLQAARDRFEAAKAARAQPPMSDLDVARQEVAAGRLDPAIVARMEAKAAPVAAAPPPQPQPPAPAPIATPAPAPPQPVAVSPQAATNALGLAAARAKVPLTLKEIQSLVPVVQQGTAPADAIAAFVQSKDPAAALAKMPGMMTDAEVQAALDARNNAGKIKTPSAETARARKAAQP